LARSLGLEPELIGSNPEQRQVYIVNRGRLIPLPEGVMLIVPTRFMPFIKSPLISWPGKVRMGLEFFIPPRRGDEDESIGSFVQRRLGREALEKIAEPLMSGIHVSDPETQSLLGTFPRFRALEKNYGGLIRGMLAQRRAASSHGNNGRRPGAPAWKSSAFVSFTGGMSRLVEALTASLTDGDLLTGTPVVDIQPIPDGGYELRTGDGQTALADAVILTTPAFTSARLVSHFAPGLAHALDAIRYVSTATVSLAYHKSDLPRPLEGSGFIAPRREKRSISACTWSSSKFSNRSPEDSVLLRCFVGGPGHEELVEYDDARLVSLARRELADLMGLNAVPRLARVFRWVKANPQYDVGHLERVSQMHASCAKIPGLFLAGSAFEGVGIPDCIHQGQNAAEKVLDYLTCKSFA
jgi:oxygen-dependent protoporphyrinogen oxidase